MCLSAEPSSVFGCKGELWDPVKLPYDWSYAGYRFSEASLPNYPQGVNVRDFGARGDGNWDDSDAITAAINAAPQYSAVYLPAGRYRVTKRIFVRKSVVLRGAGQDRTTIYCPLSLTEVYGNSWAGGEGLGSLDSIMVP